MPVWKSWQSLAGILWLQADMETPSWALGSVREVTQCLAHRRFQRLKLPL